MVAQVHKQSGQIVHPQGDWCEKIRGKMHSFGPRDDPDCARNKSLRQKSPLHTCRKPCEETEGASPLQHPT